MGTGRQEGKWPLWVQDKVEPYGICLVRQPSTRRSNDIGGQHYYDREKRRCLVLDERVIAPFSYSAPVEKFGLPAPDVSYLSIKLGRTEVEYQTESMSTWMYNSREAKMDDLDSIYQEVAFTPDEERELGAHIVVDSPQRPPEGDPSEYSQSSGFRSRSRSLVPPIPPTYSQAGESTFRRSQQASYHSRPYIRRSRSRSPSSRPFVPSSIRSTSASSCLSPGATPYAAIPSCVSLASLAVPFVVAPLSFPDSSVSLALASP